jgi:hypothetical protein
MAELVDVLWISLATGVGALFLLSAATGLGRPVPGELRVRRRSGPARPEQGSAP